MLACSGGSNNDKKNSNQEPDAEIGHSEEQPRNKVCNSIVSVETNSEADRIMDITTENFDFFSGFWEIDETMVVAFRDGSMSSDLNTLYIEDHILDQLDRPGRWGGMERK